MRRGSAVPGFVRERTRARARGRKEDIDTMGEKVDTLGSHWGLQRYPNLLNVCRIQPDRYFSCTFTSTSTFTEFNSQPLRGAFLKPPAMQVVLDFKLLMHIDVKFTNSPRVMVKT